jgi:signal transduction histidine kinase
MHYGTKLKNNNNLLKVLKQLIALHLKWLLLAVGLFIVSIGINVYVNYSYSLKNIQYKLTNLIQDKEKEVYKIIHLPNVADSINSNPLYLEFVTKSFNTNHFGIFIYKKDSNNYYNNIYWSTNAYGPTTDDLQEPDGTYFTEYQNGYFEVIKKTYANNIVLIALIPVQWHFFIENEYLKKQFVGIRNIEKKVELSIIYEKNCLPIINTNSKTLFYIKEKDTLQKNSPSLWSVLLKTLALVCFFNFINLLALGLGKNEKSNKDLYFLIVTILIVRIASYLFPFPFNYSNLRLFDASLYASNVIHPSLGDLLINTILIFWIAVFAKYKSIKNNTTNTTKVSSGVAYVLLAILTISAFTTSNIISSLVVDSKISLDVSNFFSLNIYSIIALIILCLWCLTFYHFSHLLFKKIWLSKLNLLHQTFTIGIIGLTIVTFLTPERFLLQDLFTLLWLILYVIIHYYRKEDGNKFLGKSSFLIFWLLFFSASTATILVYQNNNIEIQQRKKWAEKLAEQTDPNSETLLKIATTNISDVFLYNNFNRLCDENANKFVKDSLVNENFSGYLNKYDTRIYVFDSLYKPVFNDDSTSYAAIKTIILNQCKETQIPNLYTYEGANNKQNYIYEKAIQKNKNKTLGYIFVFVKSKTYKSEAIYPVLFKQVSDLSSDFNTNYAYAIYNNNKLVEVFNNYNFLFNLTNSNSSLAKFETKFNKAYSELWHYTGNGKTIIIAKKNTNLIEYLTLVAYLFFIFLFMVGTFNVLYFLIRNRLNKKNYATAVQVSIKTQIHATIIFISIFSFIVIGAATISFFIYRFKENNQDKLNKAIQNVALQLENQIKNIDNNLMFDDELEWNEIKNIGIIEKLINEAGETLNTDINLYDINGKLITSTQPYIYNKHLLNEYMHPIAFKEMYHNKSVRYMQTENIGNFEYISIYEPLNNTKDEIIGYVSIPYLNSQTELNQEISNFLATLINLNAIIFLLAGAIAYLATDRITSSFKIITNQMNLVTLENKNKPIEWNRNDEIGALINEYNKMVQKLEQSAIALAQSEREGAWREMARQVAHEIKNPLTPMKLSIQYLEKVVDSNNSNTKELTKNVAATLIEQIEQLSKIAGDFSQFANITNIKLETFKFSEIIEPLIQLHSTNPKVKIQYTQTTQPYNIKADRVQMSRLFTNLITNAIEAPNKNEMIAITISEEITQQQIAITITDNAIGIPEEMKEKIFEPNFTTKNSGTGLGLAICKGIVEKANGHISFTSTLDKGTSFIVTLPITV